MRRLEVFDYRLYEELREALEVIGESSAHRLERALRELERVTKEARESKAAREALRAGEEA